MFTINPFAILSETIPSIFLQSFVILMIGLIVVGTVMDMIHKKNVIFHTLVSYCFVTKTKKM